MNNQLSYDPGSFVQPHIKARLLYLSRAAGIVIVTIAVLALIGWLVDIETLKRVYKGYSSINPLAAVCFILSGICLVLVQEPVQQKHVTLIRILAGIVAGIGTFKLLAVLAGFDFVLDRLLFSEKLFDEQRGLPNRMPPNSAFCFMLSGLALLLIDVEFGKRKRPAQFMSIVVTLVALLSIYGYVYGVTYLIGLAAFMPMAAHAALLFLLLAIGILFARPDKGSMSLVFGSEETGDALFSRLIAMIIPLLLGWLKLQGERVGYFSKEFGTALFALSTYALSMFLLGRNALMKYRIKKQRLLTLHLLQEDAKKLQLILDNTASPVYIKNLSATYEQVNRRFESIFKVKGEEVKGKTEYDIFPKEIAEKIYENDKEVLDTGTTKYLEEVYKLDKGERTYLTVKFPLKDTEGEMYGLCSISTDITDRKLMETLLRDNERRLNAILSGMGEAVVVVDTSGRFIFFNEIAEEMLGLGMTDTPIPQWSETYGTFLPDRVTHFPPEELPLARGLKGESTDNVEIFVRNQNVPDGRAVKLTGRPIYNDKNEIIASVVVCRDITYEKELEHLIHENEERLHAVIATIGEGVVVADRRGRFVLFNRKAEEILGVGLDEMSAAGWSERFHVFNPDGNTVYPPGELPLAMALRGESTNEVELCIKSARYPHGKLISVSGRPIKDEHGKIAAAVVDFRDVSEVRHLEHALEEIKGKYRELISKSRQAKQRFS